MRFLLAAAIAAAVLVVGVLALAGAVQGDAPVVRAETPRAEALPAERDVTLVVPPAVERDLAPAEEEAPFERGAPTRAPAEEPVEGTTPAEGREVVDPHRKAADERLALQVARIAREARLDPSQKERVHLVLAEEAERQRRAYEDYRESATDALARGRLLRELKEVRLWKERELEAWLGEELAQAVLAPRLDEARTPETNPSRRNP